MAALYHPKSRGMHGRCSFHVRTRIGCSSSAKYSLLSDGHNEEHLPQCPQCVSGSLASLIRPVNHQYPMRTCSAHGIPQQSRASWPTKQQTCQIETQQEGRHSHGHFHCNGYAQRTILPATALVWSRQGSTSPDPENFSVPSASGSCNF